MDSMLGENKNLKDTSKDSVKDPERKSLTSYGAGTFDMSSIIISYTKTNKLVTALYMVTDTMEKEEPIRSKLRTLGIEILSDTTSLQKGHFNSLDEKISSVLSFLSIASDINMISEMNYNILKKEFVELKQSIKDFTNQDHLWLEEFISKSPLLDEEGEGGGNDERPSSSSFPNGHQRFIRMSGGETNVSFNKGQGTRIGVQKGSTLLKALSKVEGKKGLAPYEAEGFRSGFDIIKNKRRELIIKILKARPSSGVDKSIGASIKDIIIAIKNLGEEMGEKTLQRELVSMVKDNVLKKTGEKRWSQYFLN
ncbi:MAG: hypothetical protein WC839_00895 [Candidatus Paceibacterota bacterium]